MDDKNEYAQKLEARLDQWRAEIDKMQAKAEEAGADVRLKYKEQIDALRGQQEEAQKKLQKLRDAQGKAWKDFREGVESAWDELGDAVKRAADRFD